MEIQAILGSDIAMVLDECVPYPCEYEYAARSLELTTTWAKRCKRSVEAGLSPAKLRGAAAPTGRQLIFGIVQGATFPELRRQSAESLVALEFDGYAIGGVSVGEPEGEMVGAVDASVPYLSQDKPRYAMGLGTPPQMLEMIGRGIDLFDCVLPTRLARNGTAFVSSGTLNLKNAEFTLDQAPIEAGCSCPTCREFTRGYIRHLVKAEEILGLRLITLHNLHFYLDLMRLARDAVKDGSFDPFRRDFVANYQTRGSENGAE